MTNSVNQNECLTRRKNETSRGKATFFLGYEQQNSNFVRFGEWLDKILSHFQGIGSASKILNCSYNTLMNNKLQITELNQPKIYKEYSFLFALKKPSVLSAYSVSSLFIKKIHNKEV